MKIKCDTCEATRDLPYDTNWQCIPCRQAELETHRGCGCSGNACCSKCEPEQGNRLLRFVFSVGKQLFTKALMKVGL